MLACGLWHGASWTFVIWGAYHGVLLAIHRFCTALFKKSGPSWNHSGDRFWFLVKVVFMFHLLCLGWLVFRTGSVDQVLSMLQGLFFNFRFLPGIGLKAIALRIGFLLSVLMTVEIIQYWKNDLMVIYELPIVANASVHAGLFYMMVLYSSPAYQFIYFQF